MEGHTKTRKTVLCIDDDLATLELVQEILKELSTCEILTAHNIMRALELLVATKIDLVLLDMRLPVMNGLELFERLRSNPATTHIPVIFMTASTELCKDGTVNGARCVHKPFDIDSFMGEVLFALGEAHHEGSTILIDPAPGPNDASKGRSPESASA